MPTAYQALFQEPGRETRTEEVLVLMVFSFTSGTELFILHEGKKVTIKDDSMKEWKEIEIEDGNIGWLPASAIEQI